MSLVALGELGIDKLAAGSVHHFGLKAASGADEQRLVAQHVTGIDEGGADGNVAA